MVHGVCILAMVPTVIPSLLTGFGAFLVENQQVHTGIFPLLDRAGKATCMLSVCLVHCPAQFIIIFSRDEKRIMDRNDRDALFRKVPYDIESDPRIFVHSA